MGSLKMKQYTARASRRTTGTSVASEPDTVLPPSPQESLSLAVSDPEPMVKKASLLSVASSAGSEYGLLSDLSDDKMSTSPGPSPGAGSPKSAGLPVEMTNTVCLARSDTVLSNGKIRDYPIRLKARSRLWPKR